MVLRLVIASSLAALFALATGCGGTQCETHQDCVNSAEAQQAGRCAPEAACVANRCRADCTGPCRVLRADENPCSDGAICSESVNQSFEGGARCTRIPIACETVDDCPLYRPRSDGEWSCTEGVCRFPGFSYLYEE